MVLIRMCLGVGFDVLNTEQCRSFFFKKIAIMFKSLKKAAIILFCNISLIRFFFS